MYRWPKRVDHFKKWAEKMVAQATTAESDSGHANSSSTTTRRPRRRRRLKRRKRRTKKED